MPSVVDVCNKALDKLGQGAITSLEDGNKSANLCNRNWPLIRDEVLRAHPWNFAIKRTVTAPTTDTPAWGFAYAHPIPADSLRLVEVRDHSTAEYQIENNVILANDTALYIRYVARITDPNTYDAAFVDAVASRLAMEMCEALTQSSTKKRELFEEYNESLIAAKRADGQENPPQQFEEDEWISVRY